MAARRVVTKKYAHEYGKASKAEKGRLLDGLVTTTGWTRDHARRAIRAALSRQGVVSAQQRKPRPRKYSYDALVVLQHVWQVTGQPSGKYLAPVMADTLDRLSRHHEFGRVKQRATEAVLEELRMMSAATIDRYLKPYKQAMYPAAGLSTTKPGHLLRSSIPLRTCMDETPTSPGFLELDTVAHCGHTVKGDFLRTLSATCPVSGWTMLETIPNLAFIHVRQGMEHIRQRCPVPILGLDFDNGSEFINWGLIAWADSHQILVTRARPYKHNDNAHIEQRNNDWVRKHAFRYRYETPSELGLLNQLWRLVEQRKNHLLPCVKAVGWTTDKTGRKKRIYDQPRTPYQRLLDSGLVNPTTLTRLETEHARLNPARISRQINTIQQQLIDLAKQRTLGTRTTPTGQNT